jgi:hypothetical protein
MTAVESGLNFWLRYVEAAGGLWDEVGDTTVVVLPQSLQHAHGQPEEMMVTADPDVAREDGATLLFAGHPTLMQAAESVLDGGDCGRVRLPRPTTPMPDTDQLVNAAREAFSVEHGRLDAIEGARPGTRPVLRVGALVTFAVSSDLHFQEQVECWMDVPAQLPLSAPVVGQLSRLVNDDRCEPGTKLPSPDQLAAALTEVDRVLAERAVDRAAQLSRQTNAEQARETARVIAYYDEAVHSAERRLGAADAERAATLSARISSTQAERNRRLAEIAEKYQPTHVIRPFRLHLLEVPAMRLQIDVRRGDRRYPLTLDWLAPSRSFAAVRCPSCQSTAPLIAAKTQLGCQQCLARPGPAEASSPTRAGAEASPRSEKPDPAESGPTNIGAAKPAAAPSKRRVGSPPTPPSPSWTGSKPGSPGRPTNSAGGQTPPRRVVERAGRKLLDSFWDLACAGDRRLRRLYAPDSPAAMAHKLFGTPGAWRALGIDLQERPVSLTSTDPYPAADGDMLLISGEVQTTEFAYSYLMCWRFTGSSGLIEELLPFDSAYWPRMPAPMYLLPSPAARQMYNPEPQPRAHLDPVARQLWERTVRTHGLPIALRCLTAWERLPDHDGLLRLHAVGALAAAIQRVVSYRAGGDSRYDNAAAAFRADVEEVRAASGPIQRQLGLSAGQPW